MKQQGIIKDIFAIINNLSPEKRKQLVYVSLGLIALCSAFSLWKINQNATILILNISSAQKNLKTAQTLLDKKNFLSTKVAAYNEFSSKSPDSYSLIATIQSIAERLGQNPLPGWQETKEILDIPEEENFEEERIRVEFRGQNTEQIVTMMEELRKEPSIVLREVDIKREESQLAINLLVATRSAKVGS
jgi:hypothetical protein